MSETEREISIRNSMKNEFPRDDAAQIKFSSGNLSLKLSNANLWNSRNWVTGGNATALSRR
jgi:hypothetical protein